MSTRFKYRALLADGTMVEDETEATSRKAALAAVGAGGTRVIELSEVQGSKENKYSSPLKLERQAELFEDLSVLLEAGMNIDQAINSTLESTDDKIVRNVLDGIMNGLNAGHPLSDLIEKSGGFSAETSALVESGEATNKTDRIFASLAKDMKSRIALRKNLIESLSYPIFLVLLTATTIILISLTLIPSLLPIYESANSELPLVVRVMDFVGSTIVQYDWVLLTVLFLFLSMSLIPSSRRVLLSQLKLLAFRLPGIGTTVKWIALARYFNNLALLTDSNVSLPRALALAQRGMHLPKYKESLTVAASKIGRGGRLPDALEDTGLFDPKIISIIEIGDSVNQLAPACHRASLILQKRAQKRIDRFLAVLTPTLTIGLGLLVGILVVSIMTTILSVNDLVLR